jgi:ESCRT-I complex subunit TSG101
MLTLRLADAPCCCRGSLPITFQGQLYHIPLGIWIPSGYPQETPRVFVLPSKQMKIRTSSSVDSNGRVTHPYLNIWPEYSEAGQNDTLIECENDQIT